jgi:hypothetical protein
MARLVDLPHQCMRPRQDHVQAAVDFPGPGHGRQKRLLLALSDMVRREHGLRLRPQERRSLILRTRVDGDGAAGQDVGVNGLDVSKCAIAGGKIELVFSNPFRWKRAPVFAFHHTEPKRACRVMANGSELGTWRGEQLEAGIEIPGPARE